MLTRPNPLYELLPAYIRQRDQNADKALEQLLSIVGDQAALLKRDLSRMYDGWFIETCDEWLVPYLGELVGVDASQLGLAGPQAGCEARARPRLSARAAVANTIALRRRKGTLWVLEELARDYAHWPARGVEFYRQIATLTHLDHVQSTRPGFADLHSARRLLELDGPFDDFCHLGDVRRVSNSESRGRYQIANVGLFVWRTRPYAVSGTPAYCREEVGMHCFTFSVLGNDTQLFREPVAELERSSIAGAENLPVPISRWALESGTPADAGRASADPSLYGADASFRIAAADWPKRSAAREITAAVVIPADLSDWSYKVPKNFVAVDPVLGRIAFPSSQPPRRGVQVTYRYGFAMDLGGGEYARAPIPLPPVVERAEVSNRPKAGPRQGFASVAAAYADWRARRKLPGGDERAPPALLIELMDSDVYSGRFNLELGAGETVAIVAASGKRPVIWLTDETAGASDAITVRGARNSRVILDGLLIVGRAVEVGNLGLELPEDAAQVEGGAGDPCEIWLRHSTLVPGGALHPNCDPRRPAEPSLVVDGSTTCIRIESSILGAIQILDDERGTREPTPITICGSIVDATSDGRTAVGGPAQQVALAELSVSQSTLIGRVRVHALRQAEDSLFVGTLEVARRQLGCVRFCYAPPDSRTPKRYACQPDGAVDQVATKFLDQRAELEKTLTPAAIAVLQAGEEAAARARVAPRFDSLRYGTPMYLRLSECVAPEIKRGAHDESELGVYHDLFEASRLSVLTDRVAEFIPASSDGGVVFAS